MYTVSNCATTTPTTIEVGIVSGDINVLALVKGEERFIFLFNDDNRSETLRLFGRYASNPELSFTWYDAAVLSQKVRTLTGLAANNGSAVELPHLGDDA